MLTDNSNKEITDNDNYAQPTSGLSVRAELAARFLTAILTSSWGTDLHTSDSDLCKSAFTLADAFIYENNSYHY